MLAPELDVIVCPSVRRSVRHMIQKQRHVIALVFWRQQSLVGDAPLPLKFALKVTHPPFEHNNSDQYPLSGSTGKS